MKSNFDPYQDVVRVYIQLIKLDSLEAGYAIEQIHIAYGARAVLRATLIITLLKMSVKENYRLPDLSIFDDITRSYPEALPLLRHAVACCCLAWGVVDPNLIFPEPNGTRRADDSQDSEPDIFGVNLPR